MPRGARLDGPGVVHHVYTRGIEKRNIFLSDFDREDFLRRLDIACEKEAAFVYAWCLMSNHFHLAIRTGKTPLSTTMRRLLTGYAVSFNNRNLRSGHLFHNRYASTIVEEETYLLALVRYIHLNPIKAGIISSLSELSKYRWTGHSSLMGNGNRAFQDVDEILGRFGKRAGRSRRRLMKFMSDEKEKEYETAFKGAGGGLLRSIGGRSNLREHRKGPKWLYDERILGSGEFVETVLKRFEEPAVHLAMQPQQKKAVFKSMLTNIAKKSGTTVNELTAGGRRRPVVRIRDMICYVATRHIGIPATELANELGISQPNIIRAARRGEGVFKDSGWKIEDLGF
ncbi:MAG: transposase [Proteobacteria bacterium]|nr:transposase [Pseudomonadota bacterium]